LKKYTEIIWYGRGGQGAITASQIAAAAAHHDGYHGITTAPSFGAERRGAPVAAFLKLSRDKAVKSFSAINNPDVIVVLDPTLLSAINLTEKYDRNVTVVINSTKTPAELNLDYFKTVATADITRVALENGLTNEGMTILNTPILGAFVRATNLISMESVKKSIYEKFSAKKAEKNYTTAEIIYAATTITERKS
jgi:2-oxoacid:acceptor oxidoreductase gamma subunit (pyruvate/2-ketoisovalerate family)